MNDKVHNGFTKLVLSEAIKIETNNIKPITKRVNFLEYFRKSRKLKFF